MLYLFACKFLKWLFLTLKTALFARQVALDTCKVALDTRKVVLDTRKVALYEQERRFNKISIRN